MAGLRCRERTPTPMLRRARATQVNSRGAARPEILVGAPTVLARLEVVEPALHVL
jgi:hypothetical protein